MKRRCRIELWHLLLAMLGIYFTFTAHSIYEKEGWHGVVRYFITIVIAYLFLQWIGGRSQKTAIADCMSRLRILVLRLYRMNTGLPDGKFPRDIRALSDRALIVYVGWLMSENDGFWNELPEKISYQVTDYSGVIPVLTEGEKYQTKDEVKTEIAGLLRILERAMNMVARPEPNPRE